jgi:glycosyltransferase involved in cell wall biosynthesis
MLMPNNSLRPIGLVYWDTGFGIARDVTIVEDLVRRLGYSTRHVRTKIRSDVRERRLKFLSQAWRMLLPFRLQIHFEQIHREQFRFSPRNVIIPNPEFTDPKVLPATPNLSVISCKTRHAFNLLKLHDERCEYIGFTSADRRVPGIKKDFRRFLHVAGKSDYKGTDRVIEAWSRHPEWPELAVVWSPVCTYGGPRRSLDAPANVKVISRYLSEQELLTLQNECGVHVCPSQTEGFGHYLNEALSTGAIVVTTDAPPMNEFTSSEWGFTVAATPGDTQFMSTLYNVRIDALEVAIETILGESLETLEAMSRKARSAFECGRSSFEERFCGMINRLLK